jgi:ABC-2 type transport system permease protein
MSGAYLNSNIGSDEVKKTNKKLSDVQFQSEFKKKSSLSSLTMREIKLMNREPVFFMNGPMVIILMPLIMGVMLFVQKENMAGLFNEIRKASAATYYITLAIAGIGMFLGVTGTPSSSAISREGKAFMQIKAMPINPKDYIDAKLLHSVIIGAIASLMACILGYVIVSLPVINCIIAFVISNLLMLPIFIAGLIIDLKWPKLLWDNPVKAMKQNLNVMIVVLGEMFIMLPILAVLIIFVLKNEVIGYVGLIFIPAILSIVLYSLLTKYTEKRFYEIEV